jgi:demethylmenaquinone methyltransferase/2-methoxy-6-polyprenyl-1,4-benzoquinol methylase
METYPGAALAHRFFSGTGTSYDHIVNLCTFGVDRWWKKKIMRAVPRGSERIVDQACGTGILTFKLATRFPKSHITGVELRQEYLTIAKQKAVALRLSNVDFILGRAEEVFLNDVDCITSSYLAKYAEIPKLISNASMMLRKGGCLIVHDFIYPPDPAFARIWEIYFKLLQTLGRRGYQAWETIFAELPVLLRRTRWPAELTAALREYAFTEIVSTPMTLGTSAMIVARKA